MGNFTNNFGSGKGITKGLWRLDGNSRDFSGNGNNGVDTNITYPIVNGRRVAYFNNAAGNSTANSYITLPTGILTGTLPLSISFWMYVNGGFSSTGGSGESAYLSFPVTFNNESSPNIRIGMGSSTTNGNFNISTTGMPYKRNVWYYVVNVITSTTWKVYVNNVLVSSATGSYSAPNSSGYLGKQNIGGYNYPFGGYLSDVRIENKEILGKEVVFRYNKSKNKFGETLYAPQWKSIKNVIPIAPTVTTQAVTNISYTTAVGNGNVTDDGGSAITERGICWKTSAGATVNDNKVTASGTTGAFTANITGLNPNVTYYVNSYAINSIGTSYGTEVSFTTPPDIPVVTTQAVKDIAIDSAEGNGNVLADNGAAIIERGVCWSLTANPTTANNKSTAAGTLGAFIADITGLTIGTTYHVRAYATNSVGTGYGTDVTFLTQTGLPTITINGIDRTALINQSSLEVTQILGSVRDTANFNYSKYGTRTWIPAVMDSVIISDGNNNIFGGRIVTIDEENINSGDGTNYKIQCVDFSIDLDGKLVTKAYNNQSVYDIISDMVATYSTGFTINNVVGSYVVPSITWNLQPISQCLTDLATLTKSDWYIDADKDVHFFTKYTNAAPFGLTDTSGNYVNNTLSVKLDGTQIANKVTVKGGQYNAASLATSVTIADNVTTAVTMIYPESNISVTKNGTAQTVGIAGIDTFATKQVLYDVNGPTLNWATALAQGDVIVYTGNPSVQVMSVVTDNNSIVLYGTREKYINDTSITDLTTARKRGQAELLAYNATQVEANFETYVSGLRAGMVLTVDSTRKNGKTDFLIKQIRFALRTHNKFSYQVQLVTVKTYTLTELLSSLLKPANQPITTTIIDTLYTDIGTITISELTYNSNTEPTWVLGPYTPTGLTDTKRVGLIGQSLKVY